MSEPMHIDVCTLEDERLSRLLTLLSTSEEDPVGGLAGYLVTEDPTYLPDNAEIKLLARSIGRDRLLRLILSYVLTHYKPSEEV